MYFLRPLLLRVLSVDWGAALCFPGGIRGGTFLRKVASPAFCPKAAQVLWVIVQPQRGQREVLPAQVVPQEEQVLVVPRLLTQLPL